MLSGMFGSLTFLQLRRIFQNSVIFKFNFFKSRKKVVNIFEVPFTGKYTSKLSTYLQSLKTSTCSWPGLMSFLQTYGAHFICIRGYFP